MSFKKLTAFTKDVSDLADDVQGNPADLKAYFDAAPEELRTYFNNLIDALKSTASGDSGAKNTGATAITGLTGTDVQSLLESLKKYTEDTLSSKTQSDYQDLTLMSNWANYGLGHHNAQVRKYDNGDVDVRGVIKGGITDLGTVISPIPQGMWPSADELFTVSCFNTSTNTKTSAILKISSSDGKLTVDSVPGNWWLSLSGIRYSIN
jgi:hypothetical protein